jgi:Transposase DDE domain group 1
LLRQVADSLGLFDALDAAIPDPRNPVSLIHDQRALIAQRITAIALGSEDLNDHQALRRDPVLQRAAGKPPEPDRPRAAPPTRGRLENRVDRTALVTIAEVLVDQFRAAHPTPPEHGILDVDATDDRIHGRQERRFFHGSSDHHGFLPVDVVCDDELLTASLRPSALDAAKPARAVLKLLVRKLRSAWPEVRITIRGDRGFGRWRLMRWCDSDGIGSVLGLARNPAFQWAARDAIDRAERQFRRAGQPQRIVGSVSDAAGSWDRTRPVIVTAEPNAQGANPRFVVVNVPGDPQDLSEDVSCQRGAMANRIKEQPWDRFADRTRCHRFLANQFRWRLSPAADVRVQAVRRTALVGTEVARAPVGTIRLKVFQVAARVVVTVRRVMFPLASSDPYQAVVREVFERLASDPGCRPASSG